MRVWLRLKAGVSNARGVFKEGEYVNWPEETALPLVPDHAEIVDGPVANTERVTNHTARMATKRAKAKEN